MAITFDTLKFVQTLESAGVGREQASAIAAAVRDAHDTADVATKGDIVLVRRDMDVMRKDIEALELRLLNTLTLRLGAMLAVAVGILLAVLPMLLAK